VPFRDGRARVLRMRCAVAWAEAAAAEVSSAEALWQDRNTPASYGDCDPQQRAAGDGAHGHTAMKSAAI
jgi:hypothetical protein